MKQKFLLTTRRSARTKSGYRNKNFRLKRKITRKKEIKSKKKIIKIRNLIFTRKNTIKRRKKIIKSKNFLGGRKEKHLRKLINVFVKFCMSQKFCRKIKSCIFWLLLKIWG
jgi:hypothetical protein